MSSAKSPITQDIPLIGPDQNLPEFTFKVFVLSILLAIILGASNVYLALKIGTTISASIPASVLSISILRFFRQHNILESNIVQTAASAGEGVAAAVAYTLPAMLVLHIWSHFPYWEVATITTCGGIMGVLFSVPLRRVMLNLPNLRFPEGTAIGNVLRISTKGGAEMKRLVQGSLLGAGISFMQTGLQVLTDNIQMWTLRAGTVFGMGLGFSPAPIAAGYIVGFQACFAIFLGLVAGWVGLLPVLGYLKPTLAGHPYDAAMTIWSDQLRYIGVGTMMVGGVWTLFRLIKPLLSSLRESLGSWKSADADSVSKIIRTERDIPFTYILMGCAALSILFYFIVAHFLVSVSLGQGYSDVLVIALTSVIYLLVVGFMLATLCAYFTGLVGSTNNPLSGMLLLGILMLGLIYNILFIFIPVKDVMQFSGVIILVVTIVAAIASVSNENLQDLKAGQMVGATPWRQQVILIVGVVVSSLVISPTLELLFQAYGIGGVFPHPGMNPASMLSAPQANLIAAVTTGVLSHHLDWNMIELGIAIAVVVIFIDEWAKRHHFRVPVLAFGLGIYLPPEVTSSIIIGGFLNGYVVFRRKKAAKLKEKTSKEPEEQESVLMACGIVAGAALMGVLIAIPFVLAGRSDVLAIMPAQWHGLSSGLGLLSVVVICSIIYRLAMKKNSNA